MRVVQRGIEMSGKSDDETRKIKQKKGILAYYSTHQIDGDEGRWRGIECGSEDKKRVSVRKRKKAYANLRWILEEKRRRGRAKCQGED